MKKHIFKISLLIIIFLISSPHNIFSQVKQEYHTKSKQAIKYFEKAYSSFKGRRYQLAIDYLEDAIKKDARFIEAHLLKAEISDYNSDFPNVISSYKTIYEIDSFFNPFIAYKLSLVHYRIGKYSEAKRYIDFFCNNTDTVKYNKKYNISKLRSNIYFSEEAVKHPVDFQPINIGSGINTHFDEYWPSLSADEEVLVFTRQIPINPNNYSRNQSSMHEDLFISYRDPATGNFEKSYPLPGNVNTLLNEGAQCISADGKTCIITCCNRPDGLGKCDLYIMFLQNNKWTEPQNMRSVNTNYWESNPSLTADGKYLYFASGGRPQGYGKTDIWRIEIDKEGNAVSKAENLGNIINTPEDELSPFIHPDGKTLYFASEGHVGLGDLDLYYSKLDDNGQWSKPVNLGYPINTHGEERSLIVNAKGNIALFASTAGGNNLDIFYFQIPEAIKPTTVTYVKGFIYDITTNKRLEAKCEMIELETGKKITEIISDASTGEYMVCLPINKDYAFNVDKKGYLFYSENFSLTQAKEPEQAQIINIPLTPLNDGVVVVLKNIFFDFNSYELLTTSFPELNRIVEYMTDNPQLKIEIGGHTDNIGTKQFNKTLSENRAKAVYNYLISKNIDKSRLTYKGYDFSIPISDNTSEEGRAKNRRTEFKVISNKN